MRVCYARTRTLSSSEGLRRLEQARAEGAGHEELEHNHALETTHAVVETRA